MSTMELLKKVIEVNFEPKKAARYKAVYGL